jgi:type II secretory pathway component PulM
MALIQILTNARKSLATRPGHGYAALFNLRFLSHLGALILAALAVVISTYFYLQHKKALGQEYQLHDWLRQLPDYDPQESSLLEAIRKASLATTIIQSAAPEQIVLERIYPKGENEVSCFIGSVPFNILLSWLEKLKREHPSIQLTYFSANRLAQPDPRLVSATLIFTL